MGGCGSKSADQQQAAQLDAQIATQARIDHEAEQAKIKLLLLGKTSMHFQCRYFSSMPTFQARVNLAKAQFSSK
jgi:hypothetical protein